ISQNPIRAPSTGDIGRLIPETAQQLLIVIKMKHHDYSNTGAACDVVLGTRPSISGQPSRHVTLSSINIRRLAPLDTLPLARSMPWYRNQSVPSSSAISRALWPGPAIRAFPSIKSVPFPRSVMAYPALSTYGPIRFSERATNTWYLLSAPSQQLPLEPKK